MFKEKQEGVEDLYMDYIVKLTTMEWNHDKLVPICVVIMGTIWIGYGDDNFYSRS
jgi:hypothetical protein